MIAKGKGRTQFFCFLLCRIFIYKDSEKSKVENQTCLSFLLRRVLSSTKIKKQAENKTVSLLYFNKDFEKPTNFSKFGQYKILLTNI